MNMSQAAQHSRTPPPPPQGSTAYCYSPSDSTAYWAPHLRQPSILVLPHPRQPSILGPPPQTAQHTGTPPPQTAQHTGDPRHSILLPAQTAHDLTAQILGPPPPPAQHTQTAQHTAPPPPGQHQLWSFPRLNRAQHAEPSRDSEAFRLFSADSLPAGVGRVYHPNTCDILAPFARAIYTWQASFLVDSET